MTMEESNRDDEDMTLLGPITRTRNKRLSEQPTGFLIEHNVRVEA